MKNNERNYCLLVTRRRIIFFPRVRIGRMPRHRDMPYLARRGGFIPLRHVYFSPIYRAPCSEICPLDQKSGYSWCFLIQPVFCFGQPKPRDLETTMNYLRDVFRTSQGVPLPLIVALIVSAIVGIFLLVCLANCNFWRFADCI